MCVIIYYTLNIAATTLLWRQGKSVNGIVLLLGATVAMVTRHTECSRCYKHIRLYTSFIITPTIIKVQVHDSKLLLIGDNLIVLFQL